LLIKSDEVKKSIDHRMAFRAVCACAPDERGTTRYFKIILHFAIFKFMQRLKFPGRCVIFLSSTL